MSVVDAERHLNAGNRALPQLTAELFTIPLEHDRYLIYAPLRRAAFVANTRMVNLVADLQEERISDLEEDDSAIQFLRRLEIVDGSPEHRPLTHFQGSPRPTRQRCL